MIAFGDSAQQHQDRVDIEAEQNQEVDARRYALLPQVQDDECIPARCYGTGHSGVPCWKREV